MRLKTFYNSANNKFSEKQTSIYNMRDEMDKQMTTTRDGLRRAAVAMISVVAVSYLSWPPAINKTIVTQLYKPLFPSKNYPTHT